MLHTGQKVKLFDKDAVVLLCSDKEVLVYITKTCIKWVDKSWVEPQNQIKRF